MISTYLGENIPKLGFGMMRLPMIGGEVDIEQVKQMADEFVSAGFTYFDTAYPYIGGKSEEAVKTALIGRYPRESIQIASKMPVWMCKSYDDFGPLLNFQLERTGAGYFDFYLLHALDANRMKQMDDIGGWDFVKKAKTDGLIRHFGFSFHDTADVLDQILSAHPEAEFVQLQLNYADWEDDRVQSRLCYETARKHNTPIIVMEPVKGGNLATMPGEAQRIFKEREPDQSVASWAMRYVGSLEGIITVLSGMSNLEQMRDNIRTMKDFEKLSETDHQAILRVVHELAKTDTVPCTACQYCVDDCPQDINIPEVIGALNTFRTYQDIKAVKGHYTWVTGKGGKAADCIECGECESHCPQHIAIIEVLKEASAVFDV
jgi:predicted aldo/keto reductase-like oxidoreductase